MQSASSPTGGSVEHGPDRTAYPQTRPVLILSVAATSLLAMSLVVAFTSVTLGALGQAMTAVGLVVFLLNSRLSRRIRVALRSARAGRSRR